MISAVIFSLRYLLVYLLITYGIAYGISAFIEINEIVLEINEDYINFIDTILYAICILIFIRALKKLNTHSKAIERISVKTVLVTLLLILCYRIFEDPIFNIQYIVGASSEDAVQNQNDFNLLSSMLIFLNVVLLGPIVEELLFRGLLLNKFERNRKPLLGIFFTSLLFILVHLKGFNLDYEVILLSFLFSVLASIIYLKYGLIHSIIFHCGYNTLWFLIYNCTDYYYSLIFNFGVGYWITFSLGIIILFGIVTSIITDGKWLKNQYLE